VKTAVLLGAGGLGCPAALALRDEARVRGLELRLVIVDGDRVDRSNLSRQLLYTDADVGQLKAEVAARKLGAVARVARFDRSTAGALLAEADVVLDGTDNFETRFCANDEALARGIPLVHGATLGWSGQLLTVVPGRTGCLRCLFEGPPPEGAVPACSEAGVLSPLCGVVGATMARCAVQLLDEKKIFFFRGAPEPGVLYRWDARRGTERPLPVKRDPACAACARVAS
jgi:molybdopterin/thiamine biosynthesis adenylyltransferase